MSFYQINLAVFSLGNAFLLYRQYRSAQETEHAGHKDDSDAEQQVPATKDEVKKFELDFFVAYGLAVAADWLQVCARILLLFTSIRGRS